MVTVPPDDELPRGIARFWSADGRVAGCGFLIAERTLCTCAHVVASALGTADTDVEAPSEPLWLDFPLLHPVQERVRVRVAHWVPVLPDGGGDMALLRLERAVPGAAPARMAGGDDFWDHRFRVLGFPQSTGDHGVWVQGRLRGRVGRGWTSMETRESFRGPAIGQGFSGAPVWDIEQRAVVGMTVAADHGDGATTAYLIPVTHLLDLDPALRVSPFRGLEAFREQDAAVFFGRAGDSERIVHAVRVQPFVPVAGASGVGKSSLVRAGVLPLLRAAGYTVTDFVGQPGAAPVRVLLAALQDQFPSAPALCQLVGEATQHATEETAILIGARLLEHSGPAGHVIVLDQFEETVGAEPARARELLDALLAMTRARGPNGRHIRLLTTLRSASLEELAADGVAERLSVTVQMIAPMTPRQLAEIVRRPLDGIPGIDFEPGLAERIVADAGTEPGALPLVEFVLARLWDHRDGGRLTHAVYRELGGVEGALAAYADQQLTQVCKAPDGPDVSLARRLFEQLTLPDGDQGYACVARAYDALPTDLRDAAQALAATRLLVIGRDSVGRETVTLAHESLVRQWPTLRGWLDESRAFRVWQERLRARMREWEEGERHSDLLLRGQEFVTAREKAGVHAGELNVAEAEFIDLSRRHGRRTARRGRAAVALVAVLAVVAGLLVFLIQQAAEESEERDKKEAANRLAMLAEQRFATDPVEGAALAVLAHRTAPTDETYRALLKVYPSMSMVDHVDHGLLGGQVESVAASADGGRAAVLSRDDDGGVQAFVVTGFSTGKLTKNRLENVPEGTDKLAMSDDGGRVAASAPDGSGRVWSAFTRESLDWWSGHERERLDMGTVALDFSADGRRLVQLTNEQNDACVGQKRWHEGVYLRDIDDRSPEAVPVGIMPSDACLTDAALPAGKGANGRLITVTDEDDSIDDFLSNYVVRVNLLSSGYRLRKESGLQEAFIGAGGRSLAVLANDALDGHFLDPATGKRVAKAGTYWEFSWSDATGRFVGANSGSSVLWRDTESGRSFASRRPDELGGSSSACPDSALTSLITLFRNGPVWRVLCDADVVAFATRPVRHFSPDRLAEDIAFAPSGAVWSVLGSTATQEGPDWRKTVSVLGGNDMQTRRVGPGDVARFSESHVVLSGDGRHLVVWGPNCWALYRVGVTGLKRINRKVDLGENASVDPLVRDVRPAGNTDFLMLGAQGIQRLEGGSGDLSSVPGPDCGGSDSKKDCLAIAVSPRRGGKALVLRRDGTVTSWDPDDGTADRPRDMGIVGDDFTPEGVRFRDDGSRVAVALRAATVVWNPATGLVERELPTGPKTAIATYSRDGLLVLLDDREGSSAGPELWSDQDGKKALGSIDGFWAESAWRIRHQTLYNGTESTTWELPLNPAILVTRLCQALADYDPSTLHRGLPKAAHKQAPCPDPRKESPGQGASTQRASEP